MTALIRHIFEGGEFDGVTLEMSIEMTIPFRLNKHTYVFRGKVLEDETRVLENTFIPGLSLIHSNDPIRDSDTQ